jgi:class 3 adenylate cyclase
MSDVRRPASVVTAVVPAQPPATTVSAEDWDDDAYGHAYPQDPWMPSARAADATHASGAEPTAFAPGSLVAGRYRIERLLGVGGRKRVHLAHDVWLQRPVALCTVRDDVADAAESARLRAEAALLAQLGDHPHIVAAHDITELDGGPLVICQYLPGGSLEEHLRAGPVPVATAVALASDVARALDHAHALGVVHRDVKPANIWLDRDGGALLGDFGLAAGGVHDAEPEHPPLIGTAAYMAPEQAVGEHPQPASDLYALGAVLYELLCARPPFTGPDVVDVLRDVLTRAPDAPSQHRPDVPAALDRLVLDLLAKQVDRRPDSASAVLVRLADIAAHLGGEPAVSPEQPDVPAPARRDTGFVGREDELRQLHVALEQAAAGRGGLTLLIGEAGMGKTRTALELAAEAAAQGWSVFPGRCHEGDGAPAFWPWTQVLRAAARERGLDQLRTVAAGHVGLLAGLLPDLGVAADAGTAGPVDADRRQFQLFDAVTSLLDHLSADRPVLVVLDDVHWGDPASLALARFAARQLADTRVAVLACARDLGPEADAAVEDALARLAAAASRTVRLAGLAVDDTAVLLHHALGVPPDATLLHTLHERTEGNPFFLAEIVRLLRAEKRVDDAGMLLPGPDGLSAVIPDGVRDVLHRRLRHVSSSCADLLRTGSVLGRELRLDVLCTVAGVPPTQALDLLEEAVRSRLVVPLRGLPVRYRFAHALVQEALYDELPAGVRARLHRAVGQTLAGLHAPDDGARAAEVAHHLVRGAAGDDPKPAVHWSVRAARAASASAAHEDAVAHYARALALVESAGAGGAGTSVEELPSHAELLLALGEAQCRAGDTDAGRASCRQAAQEALVGGDADLLARAALGLGVGLGGFGFVEHADGELLSLLEEALAALDEEDSGLRVRLMSRLATELYFTPFRKRRLVLSEQAVRMAARLGQPYEELVALYSHTLALLGPDGVDERHRSAAHVVRLATALGDEDMAFRGHCLHLGVALEMGTREQAEADVAACHRIAEAQRHPVHRWQAAVFDAMFALLDGDFGAAQVLADEALVLGRRGHGDMAMVMYGAQTMTAAWGRGRIEQVVDAVRSFADQYPYAPAWRAALAFCHLELGRLDAARAELDVLAQRDFSDIPRDGNFLTATALLAHVAAGVGDRSRAALLEQALTPYAGRTVVIAAGAVALASVELSLGVLRAALGDADGALVHLARAQQQHERWGARAFVVWTAQEQLRVLLGRAAPGDREAAAALVAATLPVARDLGMARHVERLLTAAVDLRAPGASSRESLHVLGEQVERRRPHLAAASGSGAPLTVLLTDVAGSATLTERLGEQAVHALLVEHRRRVEASAATHGGVIVKSLGDGLLLAFTDATAALWCAVEVQRLHVGDDAEPDGVPVRLRIGLHTGPVLRAGESMYGRTMILAFRIADRSGPGEILVSAATRAAVADVEELRFDAGRRLRLKGFDDPQRVYRLLWRDECGQDRAKRSSA